MYNTSNEIMIESIEIELLVTEGFADKTKNVLASVIKRVRELITKILTFIKGKFTKQTKQTEEVIKVVEKKIAAKEIVSKPELSISTLDIKKAQNLQSAMGLLLDTAFKTSSPITSDIDGDIETLNEDFEALKKLDEKYKSNLFVDYTGDTMGLVHALKALNYSATYHAKMITQIEGKINKKLDTLWDLPKEKSQEVLKLIHLLQAAISLTNRLNIMILSRVNSTLRLINK